MATFIQSGVYLDHTPSDALAQGDVVAIEDDFYGVALAAIAANAKGALAVQGVFEFVSDGVIAAGALVFWNSGTSKVSATPAPKCYIGRAVAAAASNKCRVALNASNIGKYTPIVPGSKPTVTQATVGVLTATDPTCDATDPSITAEDPAEMKAEDPSITAVDPAGMNAADPTVVDPTTTGIDGATWESADSVVKAAIEANNTAIKAVETELVKLIADVASIRTQLVAAIADLGTLAASDAAIIDDVTAIRTQLVAAIADLATLRDSDKAIIDDVQAIETSLEAGIDDIDTLKTALNAGKTDLAAVVAQLEAALVLE